MNNSGVKLVLNSGNTKLSSDESVAATYVSQASCSKKCPFLENGCYGESGNMGIHTRRLNVATATKLELAETEADMIAAATSTLIEEQPLRLHVVGDSDTVMGTDIISKAALWWPGPVWTYTHSWRTVARRWWRKVSVLASCETLADVRKAMNRGYAAALVVDQHTSDRAYVTEDGIKLVPCPNQTKGVTCAQCKLCWKDKWLRAARTVITFAAHGSRKRAVADVVRTIAPAPASTPAPTPKRKG